MLYHGELEDLIAIEFQQDLTTSENRKDIAFTFEIISVSKKEIKFQFYFSDPILILASDKISFELDFRSFEKGMPSNDIYRITKTMTRQVPIGGMPEI